MPNTIENKDIAFQPKTKEYSYSGKTSASKKLRIYLATGIILLILVSATLIFSSLLNLTAQIPIDKKTIEVGRLATFPSTSSSYSVLSGQYPTITSVKKDSKNNTILIEAKFYGDKLTKVPVKNFTNLNSYYQFNGLTVLFIADPKTEVYQKSPPSKLVKDGLTFILSNLKPGDVLYQLNAYLNEGTQKDPKLNINTFNNIIQSVDKAKKSLNESFTLYANTIVFDK